MWSEYKRVGIWYVYLTYRYPYAVCRSGSAHGTQNFPPSYSSPETTISRLDRKFHLIKLHLIGKNGILMHKVIENALEDEHGKV